MSVMMMMIQVAPLPMKDGNKITTMMALTVWWLTVVDGDAVVGAALRGLQVHVHGIHPHQVVIAGGF